MPRNPRSVQMLRLEGLPTDLPAGSQKAWIESLVRRAILAGNFAPGARLPSSRILARDLQVSRTTVEGALDRLVQEGFVVRRRGSGTYVAASVPERERPPLGDKPASPAGTSESAISRRGELIAAYSGHPGPTTGTAFTPSVPAPDLFPRQTWTRLLDRAAKRAGPELWAYGASAGLPELRRAIAEHVAGNRAVACTPDQVIVTTSAQQSLDLAARVLLDPGDAVWVEDPGYRPAVQLLRTAGARVCPVPVDTDGLDAERALQLEPAARLAYVTPSHQYPGGGLMALERRHTLLAWAQRRGGWIVEDDYDGELRYSGWPLASLQGLDGAGRVIYIGTFNKMLFPALRIAFVVAPPNLVDPFLAAKHMLDGHVHGHTQAALTRFVEDGHLAEHLRRITTEYDERRRALLEAIAALDGELVPGPSDAGLHFTAYLRSDVDDRRLAVACAAHDVDLHPLSRFYLGPPRQGLVLGFACSRPRQTARAMRIVARALASR